jgi:hypothetical protein
MKRTRLSVFLFLLSMLTLVSCGEADNSVKVHTEKTENGNTTITTDNYSGVIILAENYGKPVTAYWTPSVTDIVLLEKSVENYLLQNESKFWSGKAPTTIELSKYHRQYSGFYDYYGKALVGALYYCEWGGEVDSWELLAVRGGGDCYFDVSFDPEKNIFIGIFVNAPK